MEENILKSLSQKYPVAQSMEIQAEIELELKNWQHAVHEKLKIKNPFFANQEKLTKAKKSFYEGTFDISTLETDYKVYSELTDISDTRIDNQFWNDEINHVIQKKENLVHSSQENKQSESAIKLSCKLLLENWERSLAREYSEWELVEIDRYRQEILTKLNNFLNLLQELENVMDSLSLDTGVLFDLSKDNLSINDIGRIKKWAEYISRNEGVKQLCDMLGNLRNIEKDIKQEVATSAIYTEETIRDHSAKEEIVGIKVSNELEHVLPQELALLENEETAILFDKKYVESQLMCFDLEGITLNQKEDEEKTTKEVAEDKKMGPIIICIDTSGSMTGSPETVAKAVSLYISSRAKKQKRDCFLINFSTTIETLDLSAKFSTEKLIGFLSRSFHGGTDVAPAINYAISKMKDERYHRADLLIISDFVINSFPPKILEDASEMKGSGNKFYSLAIGNLSIDARLSTIFDGEWVYNPKDSSITKINHISSDSL